MEVTLKPELPTEIPLSKIGSYVFDSRYGFQEKHNGKRRLIIKDGSTLYSLNKAGQRRDLPTAVAAGLRKHPLSRFVLDAELMDKFHICIFDTLLLGDQILAPEPFAKRHQSLEKAFPKTQWGIVSLLARTQEEKTALAELIIQTNAEGIIIRKLDVSYGSGWVYKIKLTKTLDAVVMSYNAEGKDSVNLGLFNKDKLQRICGASLIGKGVVREGDVVEVTYLYGTRDLHIVQPRITLVRDDKRAIDCTIDQIVINRDHE
jgi:bifunctional non-homologous end joining protein LigD